ncbi:Peroxisome biosynthesis protein pex1 [Spiromyces aspiralis]|uniref:Peroxisome biosynthesis protein pex1 n=1 Tax=Spiromyces aspiralis TaxID=68401 RepID=A0ACC1HG28_9FUNG|nr:Peroxisome biosynthesis protein pex1 [Spiromyces aspiralis]
MSDRGILITGRQGSGKSSILRILAHHMATQSTILAYTRFVKCAELGGIQRTKTLRARIERLFRQARLNAPSVIALDDVDLLVPTDNEQSDSRRNSQIIETLVSVARERTSDRPILVLATAASRSHVNSRAFDLGLFGDVQEIPPPGKQERENILAAIAKEGPIPPDLRDIKFSVISYLTEGYMPADLKALYERACHEAVVRAVDSRAQEQSMVLHRDIVRAHEGFTPLSMRGVQLHSSETSWDDIGGLEDTKRILKETIELPSRYAAIFASSPLRLRSGVMLYGYPGCGKTMLASAVAKECGLNFISVKGPELLNKYIGQSEQSVRDLFQRAKAASPCVLFFDEFDSIAPRRGHDNTGVTDRVVNQFLTEMDGAEGLEGVYVLAATSRPDLIDPALLRPGRLDKSVFCGMPDSKERLEILSKHARKLNLDPSVDLKDYVDATEHYTSADLQALVYNAFLGAVHDYQAAGQKGGSAQSSSAEHNEDDGDNIEYVVHDPSAKEGISRGLDGSEIAKLLRQMRLDIERPAASPTPEHSVDQQPSQPRMMPKHFERALQDSKSTLNQTERDRLQSM